MIQDSYNKISIREMFDFLSQGKIYLIIELVLFFLYALNIGFGDIILGLALLVLALAPIESAMAIYIFSFVWSQVAVFSFGITFSLVASLLFLVKYLLYFQKLRINTIESIFLVFLIALGIYNYLGYSSLTGVSIAVYFFDAVLIYSILDDDNLKIRYTLFALVFLMITIGYIEAAIYGFTSGNSLARWVSGFGYATQLYGTLGTTRFAIYGIVGMIYPLFYAKNAIFKWGIFALFSIGVFMSVSITAIVTWGIFVLYYFFLCMPIKKFLRNVVIGIVILAAIVALWGTISKIPLIEPIALRINSTISELVAGDVDSATTGRLELAESYLTKFENASILNKTFGSGYLGLDTSVSDHYAHNTYVDMLNYWGIFGCIVYLIYQICKLCQYHGTYEFQPMLIVKVVFTISVASVSVFSTQYFQGLIML